MEEIHIRSCLLGSGVMTKSQEGRLVPGGQRQPLWLPGVGCSLEQMCQQQLHWHVTCQPGFAIMSPQVLQKTFSQQLEISNQVMKFCSQDPICLQNEATGFELRDAASNYFRCDASVSN